MCCEWDATELTEKDMKAEMSLEINERGFSEPYPELSNMGLYKPIGHTIY